MKSRFLFVVDAPNDTTGGMSRHFRFVGRELERQGHGVDYLFLDQMPPPIVPRLRGFSLDICRRACTSVHRYLRTHPQPDVIYWSVNSAFPFPTLNRLISGRIPIVGMTFGVEERWWPIMEADAGKDGAPPIPAYMRLTKLIRLQALKWATRHCDRMVCATSADRNYLLARHGLRPEQVSMIPVGVSPHFFEDRATVRDGTKLLFVGTWIWRKGIRYLVDAMQQVWAARPDCQLTIVTFPPFDTVRRWFPEEHQQRIRLVYAENDDDLAQEYASHDIFVLPSLFEGMPMSLMEAMASRMAVVTTATCGMLDLIEHGKDGLLIETHDAGALAAAVLTLLENPARIREIGAAAARKAESHTWERVAGRFLDVFLETIPAA